MKEKPTDILERIERDFRALRAVLRAPDMDRSDNSMLEDLIDIDAASELAGRKPDTIRKWARNNRYRGVDGGFAIKIGGRWKIKRHRFLAFIRKK